jgi:ComF family protein
VGGAEALCGQCQIRPPAFEHCQALFTYRTPVDHLLQRLKFGGRLELAHLLGQLMADWLIKDLGMGLEAPLPERLLPVPLHAGRLRERGFNQALELARPVARRLGVPLDARSCRRILCTAAQADLSRAARLKNMRGAFATVRPITGHVAVIDDVMTTGSTAHELARTLLKAGAERVEIWVFARA